MARQTIFSLKFSEYLISLALILSPLPLLAQTSKLLWGETHLHTSWSLDAYLWGNLNADPDTAYRFAKGLPVIHPTLLNRVQLRRPLDFLIVSDHAEMLGVPFSIGRGDELGLQNQAQRDLAQRIAAGDVERAVGVLFQASLSGDLALQNTYQPLNLKQSTWVQMVDIADKHNQPGEFTTLIGWEWSSTANGENLHRVVFTPAGGDVVKRFLPFGNSDSIRPEDLWDFLETTSEREGLDFVAIPHNSNLSKGTMFDLVDSDNKPITADYARTRMRWEPVAEIAQMKGTSETIPALSPNDEFANFELYQALLTGGKAVPNEGDYVRSALLRGLSLEATIGVNPYKLGIQAATDAHTGLASPDEDNYWGKSIKDTAPGQKFDSISPRWEAVGWDYSAQGITAVWAEENSRNAITQSFKRKEIYGTSGPRIELRMFAGFNFTAGDAERQDVAEAGYRGGVPMGGDLTAANSNKLQLLIRATKDPVGGNLDRIQVIKGWLDESGETHEMIYNVAWSGDRALADNGKLAPVGNTVDLERAVYNNSIGSADLSILWQDPTFNASEPSFYYVRVLQIPTPRHSLYDALALGIDPAETGQPETIQERAWSSPIWYTP